MTCTDKSFLTRVFLVSLWLRKPRQVYRVNIRCGYARTRINKKNKKNIKNILLFKIKVLSLQCERKTNINKQNIKIMIHSFKFRYGGRSMAGFYDDARNTLQIGKSHRGNVIDDIITLDCSCVPKDSTLRVISSLDSPYKYVRLSTRKMMFKIWRFNFWYHAF